MSLSSLLLPPPFPQFSTVLSAMYLMAPALFHLFPSSSSLPSFSFFLIIPSFPVPFDPCSLPPIPQFQYNLPRLPKLDSGYWSCVHTFFLFWTHPWHTEVPGPGIKPEPQQWKHQVLNPLHHQGTPSYTF